MARIVHIALKVEDLEKATKFYEDVFGIYQLKTGHARGHTSRHMTEGTIDLALMTYDSEDEPEAKLSGPGPCIHHFGIEVEDRDSMSGAIERSGGSIFSDKEEVALKFSDLDKATAFYKDVFGFKELNTTPHGNHVSRHLTDGNLDIALMKWDRDDREDAMLAGAGPRIHHWGLEVADREAFADVIRQHGGEILSKPGAPTLRFRAPDRTIVEVVEPGRYAAATT